MRSGEIRLDGDCLPVRIERFGNPALRLQCVASIVICFGKVRIEIECLLKRFERFAVQKVYVV